MSRRYNYFDDEDETKIKPKAKKKSAKHKLDLSKALSKIRTIEEDVHEEAEEDIEVLEEFPLLRKRVIKILWIVVAVIVVLIMAISFSASLHAREKRVEKFNTDAGNVCINYIKKYGSIKWESLDENKYGENKAKLTGLCYARQMDFNGDGRDELMLCYSNNNIYYLEVWGYKKGDFVELYKDEANSSEKATDGYWVSFYRKGKKYYIAKSKKEEPKTLELLSLRYGKFKAHGTAQYDISSGTYTVNGKEDNDDFETIELSCFRKSKADVIVDQVATNIDAFGDITDKAISNNLSDAQLKANAYYEVVKKRIDKYGEASVKTDDDGNKYIDGLAYVKLIDFDGDKNDELCLVYRTYKSMSKYDNYSGQYIYYDKPQYSLDVYEWDGTSAKRVINKECVSVYFDDDSVFYLLLKNGKKTVNLCTNNYDKENKYNYTANSKEYKLKKGVFTPVYSAKLVNDYGYKTFYINDERVYNSEWEENGYKVPFFLNDDDKANSQKYTMTYFSGEDSDSYEQTVNDTVDTIKSLNKEYTPIGRE